MRHRWTMGVQNAPFLQIWKLHPRFLHVSVMKFIVWLPCLITMLRYRVWWFPRRNCGCCCASSRWHWNGRRNARRPHAWRIALLVCSVVRCIVMWTTSASRCGSFEESLGERSEERPNWGDAHCDKNNPFFDFSPEEENGNTICKYWYCVKTKDPWGCVCCWEGVLTWGIFGHDEFGCPGPDNSSNAGKHTTSHEKIQPPF